MSATNGGYGIDINGTSITDLTISDSTSESNSDGFRMGTTDGLNGLTISNTIFQNNQYGMEAYQASNGSGTLTNVSVTDTQFLNNLYKGAYFEKLNTALFSNITVSDNGDG